MILSSWEYKVILLVIAFGSFFVKMWYIDYNYVELALYSFTNKSFLITILFPGFFILFIYLYDTLTKNYNLIIKFKDRKSFVIFSIQVIIIVSFIMFLELIMLNYIFTNLTPNYISNDYYSMGYTLPDLAVSFIVYVKLYLTIISIGFITIIIKNKYNGIYLYVTMFIYIMVISQTYRLYGDNYVFNLINPGFHSYGYLLNSNIYNIINTGIIYFSIVFLILTIFIFKSIKHMEIGR